MKKNGELKDIKMKTCDTPFIKQYVDFEYNHVPCTNKSLSDMHQYVPFTLLAD